MGKTKLMIVGTSTRTDKMGRKFPIFHTAPKNEERPCKQCLKEPRKPCSSRCEKCAVMNLRAKLADGRLQRKIEQQIKK